MMNEARGKCRWCRTIGLLTIAVVACSLPAYGAMNPVSGSGEDFTPPRADPDQIAQKHLSTAATMPLDQISTTHDDGLRDGLPGCAGPIVGNDHTCPGGVCAVPPCIEGEWDPGSPDPCGIPAGGDNFNGGCNSPLQAFSYINCGDTYCGTGARVESGVGVVTRDTDWWEVTLTSNTMLIIDCTSEFPGTLGLITSHCTGLCADMPPDPQSPWAGVVGFDACNVPTDVGHLEVCAGPGDWWIFVAPEFDALPLDCSDYSLRLACSPCNVACCVGNDVCVDTSGTSCVRGSTSCDLPLVHPPGGAASGANCADPLTDCVWQCTTAYVKTCGSVSEDATTDNTGLTNQANPPMSCSTGDAIGVLWYVFNATTSSVEILTCGSLAPADDTVFALYSGDCVNTLNELDCSEDSDCGPGDWLGRICYDGLTPGVDYYIQMASWTAGSQGMHRLEIYCPCPDVAPAACCMPDGTCTFLGSSDCNTAGGAYQGFPNTCADPAACDMGACCLPDASCVPGAEGLCTTIGGVDWIAGIDCGATPADNPCAGACCTWLDPPFDRYTCANGTSNTCLGANDTFYPGEQCETLFECPDHRICEITRDDPLKCQFPGPDADGNWPQNIVAASSDANPQLGGGLGTRRADDFIAQEASINKVCWWGMYIDLATPDPGPPATEVIDDFTVTFYPTDANRCPLVAGSAQYVENVTLTVTRSPTGQRALPDANYPMGKQIWIYEGLLATPFVANPGDCYWLEVVNNTDDGTGLQTRAWFWTTSPWSEGNGFSRTETGGPGGGYGCTDANTFRQWDYGSCMNINNAPCVHCTQVCDGGETPEGEPTCYDYYVDTYNQGCTELNPTTPPRMTDVTCGVAVCGKTGTHLCDADCNVNADCPGSETCQTDGTCTGGPYNCRDIDWYRWTVSVDTWVEYCITADYPLYTEAWNPFGTDSCLGSLGQLDLEVSPPCLGVCGNFIVPAGVYYLFVAPDAIFQGLACDGGEYRLVINCPPIGPTPCTCLSVCSYKNHGGAGRLGIELGCCGGIEPRLGGVTDLEITLDDASGFGAVTSVICDVSGDVTASVSGAVAVGNVVNVTFNPGLPNGEVCHITLDCDDGAGSAVICVRNLEGDIDQSGVVQVTDGSIIKPLYQQTPTDACPGPGTAKYDYDTSGVIQVTDASLIKPKYQQVIGPCPECP